MSEHSRLFNRKTQQQSAKRSTQPTRKRMKRSTKPNPCIHDRGGGGDRPLRLACTRALSRHSSASAAWRVTSAACCGMNHIDTRSGETHSGVQRSAFAARTSRFSFLKRAPTTLSSHRSRSRSSSSGVLLLLRGVDVGVGVCGVGGHCQHYYGSGGGGGL